MEHEVEEAVLGGGDADMSTPTFDTNEHPRQKPNAVSTAALAEEAAREDEQQLHAFANLEMAGREPEQQDQHPQDDLFEHTNLLFHYNGNSRADLSQRQIQSVSYGVEDNARIHAIEAMVAAAIHDERTPPTVTAPPPIDLLCVDYRDLTPQPQVSEAPGNDSSARAASQRPGDDLLLTDEGLTTPVAGDSFAVTEGADLCAPPV